MATEMLNDLRQAVEYLKQVVTTLQQEVPPLVIGTDTQDLKVNTEFYFLLSDLHDLGKEIGKLFNVNEDNLAERIGRMMNGLGLDSMDTTYDGKTYRLTPDVKYFVSCRADKKPECIEWLRKHPLGRELIKEDVHAKSLEKFVKEELIAKGEAPPIGIISMHQTQTLTTRKLAR